MQVSRDFTIKNGLGIRVIDNNACRVIRLIKNEWVEIGQLYTLPVDRTLLIWTETGIPASILAVALRVYELDNPQSQLRAILTRRQQPKRRYAPKTEEVFASSL